MGNFFVRIYDFFRSRRRLLWSLLAVVTAGLAFFTARMGFSEQTTGFFQDDESGRRQTLVFDNLRAMDKVMVMFTSPDADRSIECADAFEAGLLSGAGAQWIRSITSGAGEGEVSGTVDFLYDNLPIFLTEGDYARLDSVIAEPRGIEEAVARARGRLSSPMGMAVRDVVLRDPLGIASEKLGGLARFGSISSYTLYEGRVFSPDGSTMLMVIEPREGIGNTGDNAVLIAAIEQQAERCTREGFSDVTIEYFGGPVVAVHNARRVKSDVGLTLAIALVIIVAFILGTFRNRFAIVLVVVPVVFGALFALGTIWLGGHHTISAIAIGAGSAVLGIALSYSIHVVSHGNHTPSPRETVRELAWPLTVGSFTTIGAFLGLMFTRSQLLRDFGLFAALTLVGTTIFCLVFLPHLLSEKERPASPGRLQRLVERIGSYPYDRRRWLVWTIVGMTVVCAFFYDRVRFDSDMGNLSYMPSHLEEAQRRLSAFTPAEKRTVLFVSTGVDDEKAHRMLRETERLLDTLVDEGLVTGYVSAADYLPPRSARSERIARWEEFWSGGRRERTLERLSQAASAEGFRDDAFDAFAGSLARSYRADDPALPTLLADWTATAPDGTLMMVTHVAVPAENKEEVYERFASNARVVVLDRSWMTNRMARSVNDDFYLTLFIASALIFVALLISYGRIELTLMAFMPMYISWIIILGLMAILGIEFNIVSIILSTFIFGIGDDFSIFIMDGLLAQYRDGRRLLSAHKTAIFFSAFTIVVGLGALVFARHPAMHSMAVVSILGILTVIAVAYVVQPVVFRAVVTSQTDKGGFPWTLAGAVNSIYAFVYFVVGCGVLQGVIATLWIVPVGRRRKKLWFHRSVRMAVRFFLRTMITTKRVALNPGGETFEKPAVIIANHSSFIDILVMLGLGDKLVMVTNSWVWRSPFFGRIVRYCDCYNTADGYEALAGTLRSKVAEGYSVVVFPEGTRSGEGRLRRFHKGAFYLAEKLRLDIVPVVLYGNGLVSSKGQPFYIKKGVLVSKILARIAPDDARFGVGCGERTKRIAGWFAAEYDKLYEEWNRTRNPWFHDALIKNYIYKGPVLEWYMRVKVRMERSYEQFDRLVARDARVVDIGCGYGALSLMLAMLSRRRRVLGIDYDADKIAVARHSFLCRRAVEGRVEFAAADAVEYDLPRADAFILSDVLHYLDYEGQRELLRCCFERTSPGGVVIVRDGDATDEQRHRVTRRTERWSTRLVKFNKTAGELHFTDSATLREIAAGAGFDVEVVDDGGTTSNKIYIMRRS